MEHKIRVDTAFSQDNYATISFRPTFYLLVIGGYLVYVIVRITLLFVTIKR